MRITVGINEFGQRVGQDHHRAKLTDNEVNIIRDMHDQGIGYKRLAKTFEVSVALIRDIVKCRIRAQYPVRYKVIVVEEA